jgi:pyrroline-5-carboxylate reductase
MTVDGRSPYGNESKTGDFGAMNHDQHTWGFVGAGQMAGALIRGMINAGVTTADNLRASDVSPAARDRLTQACGVACAPSNAELARDCQVIVLAVKPQTMPGVLAELRNALTRPTLVASIAAGVTLQTLRAGLGEHARLVRIMPNTPALVGEGASAYCLDSSATPDDEAIVTRMLNAVGRAYRVPEGLLDAVTGLSGAGPAYVYQMIEALSDGGVRVGLPRDVATGLAAQTLLGAARMVLETGLHPAQLKDQVASPGGTTIAGLHALERGGLRAALIDAVEAATRRATELSKPA